MKKRLRKKLRLWEFQEMGFYVSYDLAIPGGNEDEELEFLDRLIEVVEANQLEIGGAMDGFFACCDSRRSATDADRETLRRWLEQQPEVSNVRVSKLVDAWYGPFE